MKRICIAISSNDKDTTIHLEIYAPEYNGNLKGLIQICHGMTEYMGRYVEFAKYFTSRGYIVFGNDIISHGHSATPRSSCLYINDWNDTVKDMVSAREYVVRKYPNLPIYLLGFSLGSFIVRTNADLTPYKKEILIGTGAQSAFLMRIMRTWIGKNYTGKMSCASDKIYDLMFGTYGKKFKGRPANYWLLTDNEKRREYADDNLVRQDVSPAFFCEFSKGMECASRNLKNPNNTIPTLFLYGKKDPVSGFGKGVRKVYKASKENNPDTEIRSFPGTHDILHDSGYESVFKAIADYLRK